MGNYNVRHAGRNDRNKTHKKYMGLRSRPLKLDDKEKKKIIADYALCQNYSAVARKYRRSDVTIKRVVMGNPEAVKKVEQKKQENTQDILAYMDSQKDKVCKLLGNYLDDLCNPDKRKAATVAQQATVMGILIDKYTQAGIKVEVNAPQPVVFNFKDADDGN